MDIKKSKVSILILISIFIVVGISMPLFTLLAAGVAALSIIISKDKSDIAGILLFLSPFSNIFKLDPEGYTFFNLLIVVAIFKIIFFYRKLKFTYKEILIILLFVIYGIVFSGVEGISSLINIVAYFVLLLLLLKQSTLNFKKIIVYFALGIIVASIIGLFKDMIPGLSNYLWRTHIIKADSGERISRFYGLYPNPNHYTIDISIALSGLFALVVSGRRKLTEYILIILLSLLGIMSLSKSFLLSLVAIILITAVYTIKKGILNIIKGLVFTFIVLGIIYFFAGENISIIFSRLDIANSAGGGLSSVTSGRSEIFLGYINHIFANPFALLFGEGLGAGYLEWGSTHSLYLDGLYYLGLFGSIIYFYCLKYTFPLKSKNFKRVLLNYLPLLILLLRGAAAGLLFHEYLYIHFMIVAVALNTNFSIVDKYEEVDNT